MTVYVVTGKLGAGKTLVAVGRIRQYLQQGRKVVTNLDLHMQHLAGINARHTQVTRLPDRPSVEYFESLPLGYGYCNDPESPDNDYIGEHRNGLIVLDECGTFLNSRNFNDPNRKPLNDWIVHARKNRWDVIFIVQHLETLDKQFRNNFAEHVVYCIRFDRMQIPFIGWLSKMLFGIRITFPKMHRGLVKYGSGQTAITVEKWWYRGTDLYACYNTEQLFNPDSTTFFSYLPPYYTHGINHDAKAEFVNQIKRKFKKVLNTLEAITDYHVFLIGLLLGAFGLTFAGTNEQSQTAISDSPNQVASESEAQEPPDTAILTIKGHFGSDDGHTYFFQDQNDRTVYPEMLGYRIKPIDSCHATLIKGKKMIHVACAPFGVSGKDALEGARHIEQYPDIITEPEQQSTTDIDAEGF